MTRCQLIVALTLTTCLVHVQGAFADVRIQEKTKFQLSGVLGQVVNIFGGKAARDGVEHSVAIKGNRKVTVTDTTSQIVDLTEEKIYNIDLKKKTYTVITFAELRRQLEESRRKAEEEARKAKPDQKSTEQPADAPQYEVDFEVTNTDETKALNGFTTRRALMTVAVREKGQTLDQNGGLMLTTELWLAPRIPEMNELQAFEVRYAQQLYGPMIAGASPQDMAAALAVYPQVKPALERMATEAKKLEGTPILTVVTADAVKSAAQLAQEQQTDASASPGNARSVSGLVGGLARRAVKKEEPPKARATFMTTSTEVLKISADVAAADVALPAGFKEVQ